MNPAPPVTSTLRIIGSPASWDQPRAARCERYAPVRQDDAIGEAQLFVVETRIGRPTRPVLGRRDAPDPGKASAPLAGFVKDGLGEVSPGRLAGAGHVEDAAQRGRG